MALPLGYMDAMGDAWRRGQQLPPIQSSAPPAQPSTYLGEIEDIQPGAAAALAATPQSTYVGEAESFVPPASVPAAPAQPRPAPVQAPQGPAAGAVFIPGRGGGAPTEASTVGPQQGAYLEHAYDTRQGSLEKVHEQQQQAAVRQAMQATVAREEADQRIAAQEQARADMLAKREQAAKEIDRDSAALASLRAPEMQIEPSVINVMAVALAGFGAALGGRGENMALQVLQKKIDGQVEKYKLQYEAQKGKVAAKQSAYGRLAEQYGDSGAEQMMGAALRDKALASASEIAARNGLDQTNQNYAELAADLSAKRDEQKANLLQMRSAQATEPMIFDPEIAPYPIPLSMHRKAMLDSYQTGTKAGYDANLETLKQGGKVEEQTDKKRALFVPTGPKGEGFLAPTEKEAQSARGLMQAKETMIPMVERLRQLRKKIDRTDIAASSLGRDTPAMAEFKSVQNDALLQLRDLSTSSPGAMDKGMQEIGTNIMSGSPSMLADPDAFDSTADAFIKRIEKRAEAVKSGAGAQSAQQTIEKNKAGETVLKPKGLSSAGAPTPAMPSYRPIE